MSEVRIPAETRTEFGKGGARRTRRAGKIPAVIYGHGADARHVSLPAREFTNAIRHGGGNVLLTLDLDGGEQLVIPKAIQRDALKGSFDHVDLLAVRLGEKVTIDVPLTLVGDLVPGGMLTQETNSVSIEAEATHLPTEIQLDLSGIALGTQFTAGELVLPEGTTLITDPDQVLIAVLDSANEQVDDEPSAPAAGVGDLVPDGAAGGAGQSGS